MFATTQQMRRDQIDQGLRVFLISVYNKMTAALALTGATAWFAAPYIGSLVQLSGWWALFFAFLPLAFVVPLTLMSSISLSVAHLLFWAYAVTVGLSMSTIFLTYTLGSIAQVFFISSSVFAAASIYGYTTTRDLTSLSSFLFMGVIGLVVASVVNLVLGSPLISWLISAAAVLVFTILTSYDSQKLRDEYLSRGEVYGFDSPERSSIHGALTLYLDFINIFIHLLQLLGQKKD